jgi:hypothetical protein
MWDIPKPRHQHVLVQIVCLPQPADISSVTKNAYSTVVTNFEAYLP